MSMKSKTKIEMTSPSEYVGMCVCWRHLRIWGKYQNFMSDPFLFQLNHEQKVLLYRARLVHVDRIFPEMPKSIFEGSDYFNTVRN